jgi:hypothetical protein
MSKTKEYAAFLAHQQGASRRKIEFLFLYVEWVEWWEANLGPDWFEKRGRKKHQYVMARLNDTGPYAPWNVKCVTQSENAKEQYHPKKLNTEQVLEIYGILKKQPRGLMGKLAKQYGVRKGTIKDLRDKVIWKQVTDLLD